MVYDFSVAYDFFVSQLKKISATLPHLLEIRKFEEFQFCYHFSLSLRVGGLNPLFDMRNRALMGCKSNMGGCSSANSIAVIPMAQISQS